MSILAPRLTALDRKVLDALDERSRRVTRVAAVAFGKPALRCDTCGHFSLWSHLPARDPARWEARGPRRCGVSLPGGWCEHGRQHPMLFASPDEEREVREVLRGLEACGYAVCRNGWWQRVPEGSR